jgi:hypothetical protein
MTMWIRAIRAEMGNIYDRSIDCGFYLVQGAADPGKALPVSVADPPG